MFFVKLPAYLIVTGVESVYTLVRRIGGKGEEGGTTKETGRGRTSSERKGKGKGKAKAGKPKKGKGKARDDGTDDEVDKVDDATAAAVNEALRRYRRIF